MTSRPDVTIHIGQIHVANEPTVIKTVVGSCIAVCLYDPALRLGGMNHFLLPTPCNGDRPADLARFGIHAMELLIGAMQKSGGDRRRLQAKVFGGGHVLAFSAQTDSVPAQNIRFIQQFLATERVPVLGWDLGGYLPRRVHFYTDTGAAYVKRLGRRTIRQTSMEETTHLATLQRTPRSGGVTLFPPADAGRDR